MYITSLIACHVFFLLEGKHNKCLLDKRTCLNGLEDTVYLYVFTYEMGSRGRLLLDLNELPAEDNDCDGVACLQPQKALPSTNPPTTDGFDVSSVPQGIRNNHAFSHASSVSGFQPFVRPKSAHGPEMGAEQMARYQYSLNASSSKSNNNEEMKAVTSLVSGSADVPSVEREEGEWSDAEGSADAYESSNLQERSKASQEQVLSGAVISSASGVGADSSSVSVKVSEGTRDESSSNTSLGVDPIPNYQSGKISRNLETNVKGDVSVDCQEESGLASKQREVRGIEASHAIKCANNPVKRKMDQHNEAKLGKKRNRQTVFLNLEDVKQAGPIKTSTPRRQAFSSSIATRSVKEVRAVPPPERIGEKQNQSIIKDQKQVDALSVEGGTTMDSNEPKSESNGDKNSGLLGRPRRLNGDNDVAAEAPLSVPRQSSWKQPGDLRQLKNSQGTNRKPTLVSQNSMDLKMGNKKLLPAKKQTTTSNSYQDTSVERLIREVTNEKFWHHPGME